MELAIQFKATLVPLIAAALLVTTFCSPAGAAASKTLVVEAGDTDRAQVPMSVDLPAGVTKATMTCGGKTVACQVTEGKLWFVLEKLDAGKTLTCAVECGAAAPPAAKGVTCRKTDKTIEILIAGQPFTAYHFTNPKPAGQQLRRPYFWPVYGPGQVTMTRPYPLTDEPIPGNVAKDHPHHNSLYVAHGAVNGADNWSISDKAGWIVHKTFECVESGPVMGLFRETLDWTTADKKPVMAEVRTARIFNLPDTHRMLDLELVFQATYGQVKFGDTKEGGLCATRMRPEFRADGKGGGKGKLINSEGQTAAEAWGKKAAWVDASGPVDGRVLGLAMFDHPGNLRHPTTWHARTYGLLTANPFGLKSFTKGKENGDHTLDSGKEMTQRYRIYFHPGDEKAANVAARYADYATPPKATWK
ncbi:MAG TPA: PmoA family protein [Phycisphaerae bacterium]|nr:PmoA family protein [Phycisphaerae bacterium]